MNQWEEISNQGRTITNRMKVPGGWLVAYHTKLGVSMVFMPDPNHEWTV